MLLRQLVISVPADNTCQWIHNIPSFRTWEERPDSGNHNGLLQIVGKPGSGKSTLMRSVFESTRSLARTRNDGTCVLSHFFNHRGDTLEHSEKGMLHSIFHQLGTLYPPCFDAFPGGSRLADLQHLELADPRAYNSALRETLKRIFSDSSLSPPRTTIFIDALDECDGDEAAGLGYFLAELTIKARGSGIQLDVCISRREYPSITFRNSIEIQMEVYNSQDIQQYIDQKLDLAAVLPEDATGLRSAIAERANGIFLWVVLAVEGILKDLESGTNIKRIINRTKSLPKELEDLFAQILDGMDSDQLQMALRLFQWAVLPTDRLRIREWHHILAFLREEPFCSLREWRESEHYTETDAQLERQIRHLSRGLIEVKAGIDVSDPSAEVASLLAGAGSLDSTTGDSRVVQPIHETVVEFLTSGRANALFKQAPEYDFIGNGHLAIATACLDYIKISEFDDLFAARERYFQAPGSQSGPSSSNPPLFGTAPASQSGPSSSIPPLFGTVRRRRSATSFMSSASSHSETNAFDKAKPFEDTMWEHNWKDDWKDEPKDERRDEWPGIDVQASPWDGQGVLSWGQLSQRSLNSWTSQDQWFREQLGAAQGAQHESTAGRSEPASLPEPETKLTPATVGEEQALADNPLWISSLPSRFGAPEPPAPSTGFPWPRVQDDSKPRGPESPISSNISQTLQEYPALASYALNRVFAHAQGATRGAPTQSG